MLLAIIHHWSGRLHSSSAERESAKISDYFRVNMASGYRTSVEAMEIIRQCGDEIKSGTGVYLPGIPSQGTPGLNYVMSLGLARNP